MYICNIFNTAEREVSEGEGHGEDARRSLIASNNKTHPRTPRACMWRRRRRCFWWNYPTPVSPRQRRRCHYYSAAFPSRGNRPILFAPPSDDDAAPLAHCGATIRSGRVRSFIRTAVCTSNVRARVCVCVYDIYLRVQDGTDECTRPACEPTTYTIYTPVRFTRVSDFERQNIQGEGGTLGPEPATRHLWNDTILPRRRRKAYIKKRTVSYIWYYTLQWLQTTAAAGERSYWKTIGSCITVFVYVYIRDKTVVLRRYSIKLYV